MKIFILLQNLVPAIRQRFQAFVRDHIVNDDPWDPETVLDALSASIGPWPEPASVPAASRTSTAFDPGSHPATEPVA